jgi:hypothetical protein
MADDRFIYPDYVRDMDFLNQAIALKGRFERRRAGWLPHLDHTKKFVIQAAQACRNKQKVVVLGSGLLLDVPVAELAELFDEVLLVDIVHLPEATERTKPYGNVRHVFSDVTGISEAVYNAVNTGRSDLPLTTPVFPGVDETTGLVVSLNILSQLYAFPCQYVVNNTSIHSSQILQDWCNGIVRAHFLALQALPCDVCLVADYEYIWRDEAGAVVEQGSTLRDCTLINPEASWTWHITPASEDPRRLAKELQVGAWHFTNT